MDHREMILVTMSHDWVYQTSCHDSWMNPYECYGADKHESVSIYVQ